MVRELRIAIAMNLDDRYEHGIARGIVRYANQHRSWKLYGYGWMFRRLEDLSEWHGDGIVARVESESDAALLNEVGVPVIDVAGAYESPAFLYVTNDDYATGVRAGEFFRRKGFVRFAFCGVQDVMWSAKRKEGFRRAVGIQDRDIHTCEHSLPWWESVDEYDGLLGWLTKLDQPAALFAANDTAALKITRACERCDIRVPDELAVLGVDNEDILCELAKPSLSTIPLNTELIGYEAAHALDHRLRGEPPPTELVPPLDVLERESTQTVVSDDPLVEHALRYIHSNACSGITAAQVVRVLSVSRRSLEIRFRAVTGRSLYTEIILARIHASKQLLRESRYTVAHIASECGFGSSQRFHEAFRRITGVTPGEYRSLAGEHWRAGAT